MEIDRVGIIIDPEHQDYGDDCNTCFATGKTPLYVYACIIGIEKGNIWSLPLPEPPNGIFVLEQDSVLSCVWIGSKDNFLLTYVATTGVFSLVYTPGGITVFYDDRDSCESFFENDYTDPDSFYFINGKCQLCWTSNTGDIGLAKTANDFNIDPDLPLKAEFWPVDSNSFETRFARKTDGTNIMIKREI